MSAPRFSALVVLILICSCGQEPLPAGLVITEDASNPRHMKFRGMDHLSYKVKEEYPAKTTLHRIAEELKKRGWQPIQEEFLHPGTASSHIVGWTVYEDKRVGFNSFVYEWAGDWRDKQNDVVTYTLQYRDPIAKYRHKTYILRPASSDVTVIAIYMPQNVAANMRRQAEKKKSG